MADNQLDQTATPDDLGGKSREDVAVPTAREVPDAPAATGKVPGPGLAGLAGKAQRAAALDFSGGLKNTGGRPVGRRIKPRRRKGRLWVRLLSWLVIGLALGGGWYGYRQFTSAIVALESLEDGGHAGSEAGATPNYNAPPVGYQGPLNKSQLRWCFREEIRVQVLGELVSTANETKRLGNIRVGMLSRCSLNGSAPELVAAARTEIAQRHNEIIVETELEQLSLLKAGDADEVNKSELVAMIQASLEELGYTAGGVDGLFGSQTQAAIKAFQGDERLEQTGQASIELLTLLRAKLGAAAKAQ